MIHPRRHPHWSLQPNDTHLLLALFLISPPSHSQSIFVGNAGEGIFMEDGNLALRDLVEGGVHDTPFIGSSINPKIALRLKNSVSVSHLENHGLNKNFLLKKLSDLNQRYQNLGFYTLQTISSQKWVFETLEPKYRNILARRFTGVVRVNTTGWELLSDEHKVALIIHESLSIFSRVEYRQQSPSGHYKYFQHPEKLRKLVGALFSHPKENDTELQKTIEKTLDIPSPDIEPAPDSSDPIMFMEKADQSCQTKPFGFTLVLKKDPYIAIPITYKKSYLNVRYHEHGIKFVQIPNTIEIKVPKKIAKDRFTCLDFVLSMVAEWSFQ